MYKVMLVKRLSTSKVMLEKMSAKFLSDTDLAENRHSRYDTTTLRKK